jgi:GntR family transcriptional regulator, transcriptional repressor for pyruvate dehydrogenase complex
MTSGKHPIMSIKPLGKENLSKRICTNLQKYIIENNLKPGDRIPSEKGLADGFGVSRGSVREALKALEIIGVIESKAGDGTFLREFSNESFLMQFLFTVSLNTVRIEYLADIRFLLERRVIELAIEKAQESDFQELDEVLNKIEAKQSVDPNADTSELGLEFHRKLIEVSKNPVLINLAYLWVTFFHKIHPIIRDTVPPSNYLRDHRPIWEAIKRKDFIEAERCLREHLKPWLEGDFKTDDVATPWFVSNNL